MNHHIHGILIVLRKQQLLKEILTEEEHIPLTEERLDVSKESRENQATVTKKPVTESKTVEVPLTREEVSIERRPATWPNRSTKSNTIRTGDKNTTKKRRSKSLKKTIC